MARFTVIVSLRVFFYEIKLPLMVQRISANKRPERLFEDRFSRRGDYSRGILNSKIDRKDNDIKDFDA